MSEQTHFDFHLTLADGCEVFIELDGPQYFWTKAKKSTTRTRESASERARAPQRPRRPAARNPKTSSIV